VPGRESSSHAIEVAWHHEQLDESARGLLRALERRFDAGVTHVQILERLAWLSNALPGHPIEVAAQDESGFTLYRVRHDGVAAPVHFPGADRTTAPGALAPSSGDPADSDALLATLAAAGPVPARSHKTRPLHRARITLLLPLPLVELLRLASSPSEAVARAWHEAGAELEGFETADALRDALPEEWAGAPLVELTLGLSPAAKARLEEETGRLGVTPDVFVRAACWIGRRALPSR